MKYIVKFFKEIYRFFDGIVNWRESAEQMYYAAATDHADLERRMKQVQRGQAPWQRGTWG